MSLNTKELQLIRSLPYPNSEQKNIDGAVMKFAVYLQESKREESLRLIKALQKGIKL